ncbi:MAG TPA: DUF748 domain-containing protein [Candidatus Eisenbacteria bacterium]|nr:DUF748 domain-containing protein [Candidatus Eisenbacteria bacterium]
MELPHKIVQIVQPVRDTGRRVRDRITLATKLAPAGRFVLWTAGVLTALAVILVLAAVFIDEPLRRRVEANINEALEGYTVRIGKLDFHPIGFSLDLEDSTIIQNDRPDPPVAYIPSLTASVHWRALIYGRLVADFEFDEPEIYINRSQTKKEVQDPVPVKERGWQEALQAIYPLKINAFIVRSGRLTYTDRGPFRPLELTDVNFRAENIRNVKSEQGVYPSRVHLDAIVFGRGKLEADGHADFLAQPHVSFKTDLSLDRINLDYFKPIAQRYKFDVQRGTVSAKGVMEYAGHTKYVDIGEVHVSDVSAEYVNKSAEPAPKDVAKKVDRAVKEHSDSPTLDFRIDKVLLHGRVGFFNPAANPAYRLFIDQTNLQISNLTNQSEDGIMVGQLRGKFMGTGDTRITINARPNKKGPDFDLKIAVENTDMRAMNDLFRAYGNFDVVAGLFSFYSEISVRNGAIAGYVRPFFQEMDVYDRRQEKEKGLFRKLYEGVIGGLTVLLQNKPRDEVATSVSISGKLSDPQTSTWETVLGLIQNAFFKAILPGFEREAQKRDE